MNLKILYSATLLLAGTLAFGAGGQTLLQKRANTAVGVMTSSLTTVTLASAYAPSSNYALETQVPPEGSDDPGQYVTQGTIECGYTSDPMAEICYEPTSIEAGCPPPTPTSVAAGCPAQTSLAAGCPKFTTAPGCNFTQGSYCGIQTYPIACGSHTSDSGYVTCSDGCYITSTPPVQGCTGSSTYNNSCVWTFRGQGGDCSTTSQWCQANTFKNDSSCDTKAHGNCSHQSWNISCITTFGGNDCTNTGGCISTLGLNCQQTSTGTPNLCGSKTSAAGSVADPACSAGGGSSGESPEPMNLLLLSSLGVALMFVRGRLN